MKEIRRTSVDIFYQNKNITADIAQDLISLTYSEKASGEADSLAIEVKDSKKKWMGDWFPEKGDTIMASIVTKNWEKEDREKRFFCGNFIIDEPEFRGRPITATIQGLSIPSNEDFMETEHSRTFEMATLKEIGKAIASANGLKLKYESAFNPVINFIEQAQKPDAGFLFEVAKRYGMAMKVYRDHIVLYREMELEAKNPPQKVDEKTMKPVTLTIDETNIDSSWEARTSTAGVYDACEVTYSLPDTEETYTYTFRAPGRTGNKILRVNETVYSIAEAEIIAQSKLREANKYETVLGGNLPMNLDIMAGINVIITGFGKFNGKYFIDAVDHSVGQKSTTNFASHKVLEGY